MKSTAPLSEKATSALWLLSLASVCLFVLSFPVFPVGDGPVHLYLAHVFVELVLHPGAKLSAFYSVRHAIQPYCLMYYLIALLETLFSPDWAEKVLICIAILLQGFGFRALARAFGRNGDLVAFLIIPLVMSFALGAGFVNFCISLGLSYFALSLWIRMDQPRRPTLLIAFVVLVLLIVLTHPVPLLILAGYIAGDLLLRHFTGPRRGIWSAYRFQLISLLAVVLAIAGTALTAKSQPISLHDQFQPLYLARAIASLRLLVISEGKFFAAHLYHGVLYATMLFALFVNGRRLIRDANARSLDMADRFFLLSLLFTAIIPLLPIMLSGGHFFAQRMIDIAWPLALAPLAANQSMPRHPRILAAALTCIVAFSLYVWEREYRPLAQEAAVFHDLPIAPGSQGVFFATAGDHESRTTELNYPVDTYAGLHALLAPNTVLLDTPWMNQPIIPLERSPGSQIIPVELDSHYMESYWNLLSAIRTDPLIRDTVLNESQFILYQDVSGQTGSALSELTAYFGADSLRNWRCQNAEFYALCLKDSSPSPLPGQ